MIGITFEMDGGKAAIAVTGRLDSATAEEFRAKSIEKCGEATEVVIDMQGLEYISSAGLRAILGLKKSLKPGAVLRIENAKGIVREVLDISGFDELIR